MMHEEDEQQQRAIAAWLAEQPLLSSLPPREIEALAQRAHQKLVPAREFVLRRGDCATRFLWVKWGSLAVIDEHGMRRHLLEGGWYGEQSILADALNGADVQATVDSSVLLLERAELLRLLRRHPNVLLGMTRRLVERLEGGAADEPERPPRLAALADLDREGRRSAGLAWALAGHVTRQTGASVAIVDFRIADKPLVAVVGETAGEIEGLVDGENGVEAEGHGTVVRRYVPLGTKGGEWQAMAGLLQQLAGFCELVLINLGWRCDALGADLLRQAQVVVVVDSQDRRNGTYSGLEEMLNAAHGGAPEVLRVGPAAMTFGTRERLPGQRGVGPLSVYRFGMEAWGRLNESGPEKELETVDPVVGSLARHLAGQRVGLSLGAGGVRGFAHLGVLEVLEREGVPIDAIAGCSMGAIVAAVYGLYGTSAVTAEVITCQMNRKAKVLDRVWLPVRGLVRGEKMARAAERVFGNLSFEDLPRPVAVMTVDLEEGEPRLLDRGPVGLAVRASGAVPFYFPPVIVDGRCLVDGGSMIKMPIDVLRRMGCELTVGVDVSPCLSPWVPEPMRRRRPLDPNALEAMMRLTRAQSQVISRLWEEPADVLIQPAVSDVPWFDFDQCERLIDLGRTAAENAVPELKERLVALRRGRVKGSEKAESVTPCEEVEG